jgi:hypothetical protein
MKLKKGPVKILAMVAGFGICTILIVTGMGFTEIITPLNPPDLPRDPIPGTIIDQLPDCSSIAPGAVITCCDELAGSYRKLYQRLESMESRQTSMERELTQLQTSLTIKMQALQAEIEAVRAEALFQIEQLNCKIDAVESVAAQERAKLQKQIDNLRNDMNTKVLALQNDIRRVERRAAEERSRLERLIELTQQQEQEDVRRLETTIAELKVDTNAKILILQDNVTQLYAEVEVQRNRILALEAQAKEIVQLRNKLAALEDRVCTLEATLSRPVVHVP